MAHLKKSNDHRCKTESDRLRTTTMSSAASEPLRRSRRTVSRNDAPARESSAAERSLTPPPQPVFEQDSARSSEGEESTQLDAAQPEAQEQQLTLESGTVTFDDDFGDGADLYFAEDLPAPRQPTCELTSDDSTRAPDPCDNADAVQQNLVLQDQVQLLQARVESLSAQLASADQVNLGYRLKLQQREAEMLESGVQSEQRIAREKAAAARAREAYANEKAAHHATGLQLAVAKADVHAMRVTREEKWVTCCPRSTLRRWPKKFKRAINPCQSCH
jgi:hypothetical protein